MAWKTCYSFHTKTLYCCLLRAFPPFNRQENRDTETGIFKTRFVRIPSSVIYITHWTTHLMHQKNFIFKFFPNICANAPSVRAQRWFISVQQ